MDHPAALKTGDVRKSHGPHPPALKTGDVRKSHGPFALSLCSIVGRGQKDAGRRSIPALPFKF